MEWSVVKIKRLEAKFWPPEQQGRLTFARAWAEEKLNNMLAACPTATKIMLHDHEVLRNHNAATTRPATEPNDTRTFNDVKCIKRGETEGTQTRNQDEPAALFPLKRDTHETGFLVKSFDPKP